MYSANQIHLPINGLKRRV